MASLSHWRAAGGDQAGLERVHDGRGPVAQPELGQHGVLVSQGPPAGLALRQARPAITFTLPAGVTAEDLPDEARRAMSGADGGRVTLTAASPLPVLGALASWAGRAGHDLPDLEVRRPTLEDAYLELTGDQEAETTS
jgi:ABC-2 type transport system ATP-binding protein